MSRANFKINSEGDCERVAKVFRLWVQQNDQEALKNGALCSVPHPGWASIFTDIYADEIGNYDLADTAEKNIIDVIFEVDGPYGHMDKDLSKEDLQDLIDELLDDLGYDEEEEDDDDA